MTLTLTLRNAETAPEGVATSFTVAGDGALIGRSRNCDWNLPDPANVISSRHCEIRRDGDAWLIRDISTNGTFLNGAAERLAERAPARRGRRDPDRPVRNPGSAKAAAAPPDDRPLPRPSAAGRGPGAEHPAGALRRSGPRAQARPTPETRSRTTSR